MWQVLRELIKSTSLYWKQLNLFLFLTLIASALFIGAQLFLKYRSVSASIRLPTFGQRAGQVVSGYTIVIGGDGQVLVNGQKRRGALRFKPEKDEFLFILARNVPEYLEEVRARVELPHDLSDFSQIEREFYGIHGVGGKEVAVLSPRVLQFTARDIAPYAFVSLRFDFPKNYFALTPLDRLRSDLKVLSPRQWILLGSLLPGATAVFLLILLARNLLARWRVRNKMPINLAPSAAPPAIIGALYHGYISKKEITATLFDLAHRGFMAVHLGGDDEIIFAKGANLYSPKANLLRPYEIFLLHQIFGEEGFAAHGRQVTAGLGSELFSSKIALTILNIYDATVAEGYFIKSPNLYLLRYKLAGLGLFFAALVALVYGAFTLYEPAYILLLWVGMLLSSLVIITITPKLPRRTRLGDKVLKQWLGFRNYLAAREPVTASDTSEFFRHLPYAVVMDCERAWIARWREQPIRLPDWFTAEADLFTAEEFSRSVVSIVEFLARHLMAARPPDIA